MGGTEDILDSKNCKGKTGGNTRQKTEVYRWVLKQIETGVPRFFKREKGDPLLAN